MGELLLNSQRRTEMAEKGRLRVSKMFTVERMAFEYAKLIRQS